MPTTGIMMQDRIRDRRRVVEQKIAADDEIDVAMLQTKPHVDKLVRETRCLAQILEEKGSRSRT